MALENIVNTAIILKKTLLQTDKALEILPDSKELLELNSIFQSMLEDE